MKLNRWFKQVVNIVNTYMYTTYPKLEPIFYGKRITYLLYFLPGKENPRRAGI
jgi:hypothetical protein